MTKQAKAVERFSVAHQFSHLKFGFALLGLVLVAGLGTARAQTSYYWDTNGATAGVGGTGSWTTNGTTWTTNAAGNVATISGAWANGNTNYAVFQGTAGVVSLSATTVFAGQIQVNVTGYTLMNNSTAGTSGNRYLRTTNGIVLGSNVNLNLSSGVTTNGAAIGFDAMITNAVGATGAQLTITGATLNADSSVRIMCDGSKADIWVPTTVATTGSGYASVKNVGSTNSIYGNVTVNSGSRLLFGASSSTRRINVKGNVTTANTDLMIGETGDVGMVVLYGSNTIGGNVLLKSGQLGYGTNNAFGTSTVVVSDGTTFGQQGTIGATDADRTINNTISLLGSVTLGLGSFSSFLGGTLDLNGATRTITLGNSAYLNGAVQNGGINVTSTSATRVLYLNGNNNYAGGTTLNGGTINLGNNAGLGTAGLTVNSNAVGNTLTATDGRNIASAINLSSGASLNLDSGSTNAPATTWTQAGAISGAGSVTKTGVGTLNLAGANSYTGSTAVSGGTLVAVTNNIRSTITSNSVAISFSNAPALGTYAVLPGALSGTYPPATFSGLAANQKASFSASAGTATVELKTAQSITFNPIPDQILGAAPIYLNATASSGLPVTYTSSNPGVATVSGNLVTLVGVGTTQITASQSGDAQYASASPVIQSMNVRGGAEIYGKTDLQNFESAPAGSLLRGVSGWSTTDQFTDSNDPTRSDGIIALPGGGTAAFVGGWYTSAAKYPVTYRFDQGASDRIVFDWNQLITSSDPAIAGAVDRFGWEFKDSSGQTLFSLKMVQFVDTNGNGDWDPASGDVPAEPLANPADDQAGGNANFVPNKVLVVGYGANGERLPTSEMANYVQLDRNSWAQFRVIADLKTKKWYAQIKNGSSYINLTVPGGASLPAGVTSLNQVAAVWELNDTTQTGSTYSMGGSNQMIFDDFSVQGAKVVILGLEVPALAAYDGAVRPANVTQDPAGVAVVSYSVLDSNGNYIALSGLPQDAGRYRVNVSVPSPYYAVDPANPTSGNSQALSGDYRITSRSVTIRGLTANDKAYNGTVYGTLSGTPVLEGVVSGDDVSIVGTPNVQFDSMEVGTAIPVRINGGYSLAGTKASNYQLTLPTFVANINKADPIVRSPAASVINYGQTLGESGLLGGASSVAGSWDWTTPSVILPAGTSSQTVTFTPTDLSHYNSVQASISVSVNKVTPTITTAPTASEIIYGQDLGASVLSSGVTSVPGSFAWTVPSTILAAGNRTQSVTFTPSDTANYNSVTTSVGVKINKAVPTIATAPTPSVITYNSTRTLANVALSGGAGSVPGLFSWQNPATVMVAGTSTQRAVFNPSENSNYEAVSFDVVVTVSKATPLISQSPTAGAIVYGQNLGSSVLTGGVGTVPGTFGWTNPSQILPAGNTPQEVTFTPEDSANYNAVTTSLYVRVNKASPTFTSLPSVGSLTFGQTLADATLTGGEASVAG
ncbi:hypothetical protein EBX31_07505, partial [bacterium]|nr:hypothetical protein [bacterium]